MSQMLTQVNIEYFNWLVSQVNIAGQEKRTYNELFEIMHEYEFVWTIQGDDNRAQDGLDLRSYFSNGRRSRTPDLGPVTVLEVLIGLSRRIAFVAGGDPRDWAWQLIVNLGLEQLHDPLDRNPMIAQVRYILERLLSRTYERNGHGGFFPLNNPAEDQTKIEIWHQLNEYVNEIEEPTY